MLNKIRKTEERTDPEHMEEAVQLIAEEAPEPVPERKTSDEMINLMAESTLESGDERYADPAPMCDQGPSEEPIPEPDERTDETVPEPDERTDETVPELDEWTDETGPEPDEWTDKAAPEFEDETDGIREE